MTQISTRWLAKLMSLCLEPTHVFRTNKSSPLKSQTCAAQARTTVSVVEQTYRRPTRKPRWPPQRQPIDDHGKKMLELARVSRVIAAEQEGLEGGLLRHMLIVKEPWNLRQSFLLHFLNLLEIGIEHSLQLVVLLHNEVSDFPYLLATLHQLDIKFYY